MELHPFSMCNDLFHTIHHERRRTPSRRSLPEMTQAFVPISYSRVWFVRDACVVQRTLDLREDWTTKRTTSRDSPKKSKD